MTERGSRPSERCWHLTTHHLLSKRMAVGFIPAQRGVASLRATVQSAPFGPIRARGRPPASSPAAGSVLSERQGRFPVRLIGSVAGFHFGPPRLPRPRALLCPPRDDGLTPNRCGCFAVVNAPVNHAPDRFQQPPRGSRLDHWSRSSSPRCPHRRDHREAHVAAIEFTKGSAEVEVGEQTTSRLRATSTRLI